METERPGLGACPKHMVYGPCADVNPDGSCEVPVPAGGPIECPFVGEWIRGNLRRFHQRPATSMPVASASLAPSVMTELPDVGRNGRAVSAMARQLAGHVDAVLFGDTNWERVQFPPTYRAALVEQEGLKAWPGINARDRNRVALEGELLALQDLGVAGVHCVTGNHTYAGHRPDAAPVFDLDSTRLTTLASDVGLITSVAASPHSVPVGLRPLRTFDKAQAGASVCFIDQPVSAEGMAAFIQNVRACGPTTLTFRPVITIVTSLDDFARWRQYSNARIPDGWVDALRSSPKVAETGLALAVTLARAALSVDGVSGVLFSSTSTPANAEEVAAVFRDAAQAPRSQ
jgi:methylenetetrahydrofolate reductase (NADPH)